MLLDYNIIFAEEFAALAPEVQGSLLTSVVISDKRWAPVATI